MLKKIILLSIAAIAVVLTWSSLANPAASQAQSRINALEVDLRGVRSRLNRVEAQLNQLRGVSSPRTPITLPSPPGPRAQSNQNEMFDRLATLVVETKQQVNKLESRVSALEKRMQ